MHPYGEVRGTKKATDAERYALRGGSWLSPQASLQSIEPGNLTESDVYTNLGIRCVKTKL